MELQLPFVRRILAQHPEVEYHIWDLAHNELDHQWLQAVSGERITVYGDFYDDAPWRWMDDIYRFYTDDRFTDCRFVKIDEDVVFLQDNTFGDFISAIDDNPGTVISAKVINNGAGTRLIPALFRKYRDELARVSLNLDYADTCHSYMFENFRELTCESRELVTIRDWLSINLIGYSYETGCVIAKQIGYFTPSGAYDEVCNVPPEVDQDGLLGDEGVVNLFPRLMLQGFLACHLYFHPQRNQMSDAHIANLQDRYAEVGRICREILWTT